MKIFMNVLDKDNHMRQQSTYRSERRNAARQTGGLSGAKAPSPKRSPTPRAKGRKYPYASRKRGAEATAATETKL